MEQENSDSNSKMEDYEVIEQIGKGSFGASFLVLHKTENKKYVLKKIRLSKQPEKLKRTARSEMDSLVKLHHPYIVQYKDAWLDKGSCVCIVTHYYEGGDISDMIRKARGAYFPEQKLCKWLTQLLLAIDYLHSNRVLHRDLKLSNIFVTEENDIRLGDFGLGKLLNEEALSSSVVGTPNYMCPELIADMPYCYKSDIWSLGCCMFEIAAHKQAFRASDMTGLINKINRCSISPLPIVYSSTLKQIMKSMLRKSPEHRPTAAELLRHPHLQPFLLRCHNPSTVFLPVKSPSPKNSTEKKMKQKSPNSPGCVKDYREREVKLKHKELLPLFEEINDVQYPSLLAKDDVLIKDKLETKRVDPTSYSGLISHDSEDSKSGDTSFETTACNGDKSDNFDSLSLKVDSLALPSNKVSQEQEEYSPKNTTKSEDLDKKNEKIMELVPPISSTLDIKANESIKIESFVEENVMLNKDTEKIKAGSSNDSKVDINQESSEEDQLLNKIAAICSNERKGEWENPGQQRADALESLLELCARLLKQDKFDELCGVLKPFGEDVVSSRETAIWLTKSLMNKHKFAKES